MSHLPPVGYAPQYSFWPHYLTPPETLLAPARRAGWMLTILGVLLMLGGTCVGLLVTQASEQQIADVIAQSREMNPEAAAQMTPTLLRNSYLVFGVVAAMFGVAATIVGLLARGGSMAASIIGILLLTGPLLVTLAIVLAGLIASPVAGVAIFIVMLLPLALMITTGFFLIQAIINAPKVSQARQQMMMFHHQQAMQYQAYAQQQAYASQSPHPQSPTMPSDLPQGSPPTPPPAGG